MTRKAYSNYLITSDPHFENDYILDIERGNKFKTIQEHDDTILNLYDRWMDKLDKKKNAAFFVLGDFGLTIKNKFGKNTKKELDDFQNKVVEVFNRHSCKKIFIRGNHDNDDVMSFLETFFDECYDYPIFLNKHLVLSHQPVVCTGQENFFNVSGHLHSATLNLPNYLNASIHVADYRPITKAQVEKCMSVMVEEDCRFLWEPYAEHYRFTQPKDDVVFNDITGDIDLSASRLLCYYLNKQSKE